MAQKSKKKTVKELNDDFIAFEDKFKSMEMLINHLNAKVALLESRKEEHPQTLTNRMGENNENKVKEFVCKICDSKFSKCTTLRVHMKEQHKKEIKCTLCEDKFDETYKLEIHLKNHDVQTFKCGTCEKTFQLKWRLNKHEEAHNRLNVKFCHYYKTRRDALLKK